MARQHSIGFEVQGAFEYGGGGGGGSELRGDLIGVLMIIHPTIWGTIS